MDDACLTGGMQAGLGGRRGRIRVIGPAKSAAASRKSMLRAKETTKVTL